MSVAQDTELSRVLECPVCYDIMLGPILICPNGHSLCASCRQMLESCPICSKTMVEKIRNRTLENCIQFLFPAAGLPTLQSDHQRLIKCPEHSSCEVFLTTTEFLKEHLQKQHNNLYIFNVFKAHLNNRTVFYFTIENIFKIPKDLVKKYYVTVFDYVFCIFIKVVKLVPFKFHFDVQVINQGRNMFMYAVNPNKWKRIGVYKENNDLENVPVYTKSNSGRCKKIRVYLEKK